VKKKAYISVNKQTYDILADEYYEKICNNVKSKNIFDYLCKRVFFTYKNHFKKNPKSVLELGPGLGNALKIFSTKYNCNVTGIELSHRMAEKAQKKAVRAAIINDDINNIDNLLESQFDIIYANAVIHLFPRKDAVELLVKIHKWLKNSGVIYISTTLHEISEEGFFLKSNCDKKLNRYRRKYDEIDFKDLVCTTGFLVIDEWKFSETEMSKQWINLICEKKQGD